MTQPKETKGRPTKYDKKYIAMAKETIGNKGKSITQFARDIKVSKSTVYLWAEQHQDFSDALDMSREWSQAHWEDKLENMMYSKEVNAPLVKLYFANRFSWHDKPVTEDEEASKPQELAISFEVRQPEAEVKTTNAKPE